MASITLNASKSGLATTGIEYRSRCLFANASAAVQLRERDNVCDRIAQKRVDFVNKDNTLDRFSKEILSSIADALIEYPEISIRIVGFCGSRDTGSEEQLAELSSERAKMCRTWLENLCVLSCVTVGMGRDDSQCYGFVKIDPSPQARFYTDPQKRIDFVLNKTSFEFVPQTSKLTDRGSVVSEVVARILRETEDAIFITIPQHSSEMSVERAESIRESLQGRGCMNDIIVKKAVSDLNCAVIVIGKAIGKPIGKPQADDKFQADDNTNIKTKLREILQESPIAFVPRQERIVSDCFPVIQRCAELLVEVKCLYCLIEVYASGSGPKDEREAILLSQKRAEFVADQLRRAGATVKFKSVGRGSRNLYGASPGEKLPRVVIDLLTVDKPEDEFGLFNTVDCMEVEDVTSEPVHCFPHARSFICAA
eukprot:TRINITY_DN34748_c0_g1_i1.p1 TRINITY_DN34748_c0_g1~~TRINITY_DN34748_c0_g1_i1.p1  ORF type:complete len:424 (-),score=57.60 TRINITY_DN34748_c0_g1_i1:27-1298(-)